MTKSLSKMDFLQLMSFPQEWSQWEMYPDELFDVQIASYEPGNELGSEHDRYGAFYWWILRDPPADILKNLIRLTLLDPDQVMAEDARKNIRACSNYSPELEEG